jgi:hypothetical protein
VKRLSSQLRRWVPRPLRAFARSTSTIRFDLPDGTDLTGLRRVRLIAEDPGCAGLSRDDVLTSLAFGLSRCAVGIDETSMTLVHVNVTALDDEPVAFVSVEVIVPVVIEPSARWSSGAVIWSAGTLLAGPDLRFLLKDAVRALGASLADQWTQANPSL